MFTSNTLFSENANKCIGTTITMAMLGTTTGTAAIARHFGVEDFTSILIGLGVGVIAPVSLIIACSLTVSAVAACSEYRSQRSVINNYGSIENEIDSDNDSSHESRLTL